MILILFNKFPIKWRHVPLEGWECHNRTFDDSGLAIVRHSLSNDKWAKPIRSSPTAKRRMLEPLTSFLREGFRKRGQREIFEREIFERDVI